MPVNLTHTSTSIWQTAPDQHALRQVFRALHAESCPTDFNFHIHTVHSDGKLHPHDVVEQAIAIGLQGFAITDHHSVGGYRMARQQLEQSYHNHSATARLPVLWSGIEINAELLGTEVHILAYAFDPDHPAMRPYIQGRSVKDDSYRAKQVIAAIHEANGLAVLAHPARYRVPHHQLIPAAAQLHIDAIETYYAYNNPNPWQPSPQHMADVHHLGQTHGLMHTCGTDTHGLSLRQRL